MKRPILTLSLYCHAAAKGAMYFSPAKETEWPSVARALNVSVEEEFVWEKFKRDIEREREGER